MTPTEDQRLAAAEKTVSILKDRVRSLYNDGAQTAIHRQLERARERDEIARQKRAVMEAKNEELKRYSAELEGEVARRTAELRAILDNVTFGFVVIDADCRVQPGFTRSCADLFGGDITDGDDLVELFGAKGSTTDPMIRMGVTQVFDDFMPTEVTVEQIPSYFTIDERRIRAEYRPIRDESDAVAGILVSLSDVTLLWQAERESKRNAALISILQRKPAFVAFVADSRGRLDACRQYADDDAFVRRSIHTVKGNAASYGLDDVAEVAHQIEDHTEIDVDDINALENELDRFLEDNRSVLGAELIGGSPAVEVSTSEFDALRQLLDPIDAVALDAWGKRLLRRPAAEIAGPIESLVERLAERLDRRVELSIEGGDVAMDPEVMQPVMNTLSHILRNAVDHGIELPDERGAKNPVGQLVTRFRHEEGAWVIEIEDDGRGINVERLVERAIERGDVTEEAVSNMSDQDRLQLIFLDGLSSRSETTEHSGRGVGMSAVLEAVEAQEGTVQVKTSAEGTQFRLRIPAHA